MVEFNLCLGTGSQGQHKPSALSLEWYEKAEELDLRCSQAHPGEAPTASGLQPLAAIWQPLQPKADLAPGFSIN